MIAALSKSISSRRFIQSPYQRPGRAVPELVISSSSPRLQQGSPGNTPFPTAPFPEDAHWNAERQAVEYGVEIGDYRGVVRVPRRVFQRLFPERPIPYRASKPTISSGPGSRASPSGNWGGGS